MGECYNPCLSPPRPTSTPRSLSLRPLQTPTRACDGCGLGACVVVLNHHHQRVRGRDRESAKFKALPHNLAGSAIAPAESLPNSLRARRKAYRTQCECAQGLFLRHADVSSQYGRPTPPRRSSPLLIIHLPLTLPLNTRLALHRFPRPSIADLPTDLPKQLFGLQYARAMFDSRNWALSVTPRRPLSQSDSVSKSPIARSRLALRIPCPPPHVPSLFPNLDPLKRTLCPSFKTTRPPLLFIHSSMIRR
ncbi:hypothetical protein NMY22_g5404 [Coprinellus aureogranulatus]|nr:hypothetical protein NMY22_g5404 [Coprinellus aureogranulatus]